MPRNPFAVLGLPIDASGEAIKAAWRRLARQHHPDVTSGDPGAERRANRTMAEINAAYQELRDPVKRRIARQAAARGEAGRPGTAAGTAGTAPGAPNANGKRSQPDDPEWPPYDPGTRHTPPVTARIDTSALLRPRNSVLNPSGQPLPGWPPRPRNSEDREPPRASTPSGPIGRSRGPNLDADLPSFLHAQATELKFGKFAGLTLGEVALIEPTYIEWIVKTIDRDPEITMAARVVLRKLERTRVARRPRLDTPFTRG